LIQLAGVDPEMKKILITGSAGFIGYHLARHCVAKGYRLDLLDNLSRGIKDQAFEDLCALPNVSVIQADLLNPEFEDLLPRDYDIIFHLAAIIGVSNVLQKPYAVLRDNVSMLVNLLEFSKAQADLERFVFASTSEVYAGTLKHFDLAIPTPEDSPIALTDISHPRTSYLLSKIYGEALCHQSGIPFTIIRPHNIYGPRMGLSHVIPELSKKAYEAEAGGELAVFSPDHRRTFCFVQDAVQLIEQASMSASCRGETLNIGTREPEIQMRDLARIIIKTVGKSLKIKELPPTPGSPVRRCPEIAKATQLIGFTPRISLEEGIQMTFDWYKKNIFEGNTKSAV